MKIDLWSLEAKCLNQHHGFYMPALCYYMAPAFYLVGVYVISQDPGSIPHESNVK